MPLSPGARLGVYEVTAKIGEGGMGEVYRARDTKLNRDVALKVLPDLFASDLDRLARFEREAQVLASLNHPNIGAIYGVEESEGVQALALELIEGPTLADRISQGPIPVDEAATIARQIADALEAAHEQGVIHRDLKPANIKLKDDGSVKVLDFGLAKALEGETGGDPSQSPTLTAAATQAGVIMGTAAYMAPEQAKGKVADKRADIWAFGVVLLEMLTGQRVFGGETISETLADVMKTEPSWDGLPADLPPKLANLLHQCLEKDPRERIRDIGDVRLAMKGAFETTVAASAEAVAGALQLRVWQRPLPAALGGLGFLLIGGLAVWALMRPAEIPTDTMRFAISASTFGATNGLPDLAISADGTQIAYQSLQAGTGQIMLHSLAQLEGAPLRGGESSFAPFFSPDGQWVGLRPTPTTLRKVSILGGPPVALTEAEGTILGATWGRDDQIIFGSAVGLFRVSGGGGEPERLTTLREGEVGHAWPFVIPDREAVLFSTFDAPTVDAGQLAVLDLNTNGITPLRVAGTSPRYVSTGHLVYATDDGSVRAVPFDVAALEVTGNPVPLVEEVNVKGNGAANFSVSDNGRLVYAGGSAGAAAAWSLVWVDREGVEEEIALPPGPYTWVRVSPDGTRLTWVEGGDVWVSDLARSGSRIRVTTDNAAFAGANPVWTPDGMHVVFQSNETGQPPTLFRKSADGTGEVEPLLSLDDAVYVYGYQFTPDGQALIAATRMEDTGDDFGVLSVDEGTWEPVLDTPAREGNPAISPDGNWVAYRSHETGQSEVYVARYPTMQARQSVSTGGGWSPVWSADGSELFYQNEGQMMVVPVTSGSTLTLGTPELLFEGNYLATFGRNYDLAPDGRFLMIKTTGGGGDDSPPPQITVVLNWLQELLERVPVD